MPTWTNINTDRFEDFLIAFNNYMQFFTKHLNSKNVQRLDTNETVITSNDGTTEIKGPILVQKDGNGTVRLMQGYDAATDTFVYALFNATGDQTVGINSEGNAKFTGDIIASRFFGPTETSASMIIGGSSNLADFRLFRGGDDPDDDAPIYLIFDNLGTLEFFTSPNGVTKNKYMHINGATTYTDNTWNLSGSNNLGVGTQLQYAGGTLYLKDDAGNTLSTVTIP